MALAYTLSVVAGLVLLLWSADRFVEGSAAAASHLGMPPLLIGMVVVGFGTSAPELMVSVQSALDGKPAIALGNVVGSNLCNIGLIIGITALVKPILVNSTVIRRELPVLVVSSLVMAALVFDGELSGYDAAGLVLIFAGLIGWSVVQQVSAPRDPLAAEVAASLDTSLLPMKKALLMLVAGLAVLLASSRLLVFGASGIAAQLGISSLVIGLTIVAIGTSLPELAASVAAARKGENEIALGNVIGSNLFNTLAVAGAAGLIRPIGIEPAMQYRDLPLMIGLTLVLLAMGYGFGGRPGRVNRWEGLILLVTYAGYMLWLFKAPA